MLLTLPKDWWQNPSTQRMTSCKVIVDECVKLAGNYYLNCNVLKPDSVHHEQQVLQLPVGECKGKHPFNLRRLLNLKYGSPDTLEDLGFTSLPGAVGISALAAAWVMAAASGNQHDTDTLLSSARTLTEDDGLDDLDILEPDPKSHKRALQHPRMAGLWQEAAEEEMSGLFRRGCFKKHHIANLSTEQKRHLFGSRFHHKIKRYTQTGKPKSCKIRLVVMGNRMEKGEDYFDSFAPVPRNTVARILMSMAAAANLEMH